MSCLTNKLKFHMIFTCKNFMLSNLTRKNFFCLRKWYGGWGKACQWNLINFSQFANALIRKEKKRLRSSQWEMKKREKLDFAFVLYFLNMIINHFFVSQAHSQPNFCFLISGWRQKYQKVKQEQQIARNDKLQHLFQK